MGRDEMRQITADRWDEDLWAATVAAYIPPKGSLASTTQTKMSPSRQPKLFFYFGRDDHWVAERTRDDLIANRAWRTEDNPAKSKPRMEIDEGGVPHGFCISESCVRYRNQTRRCLTRCAMQDTTFLLRRRWRRTSKTLWRRTKRTSGARKDNSRRDHHLVAGSVAMCRNPEEEWCLARLHKKGVHGVQRCSGWICRSHERRDAAQLPANHCFIDSRP